MYVLCLGGGGGVGGGWGGEGLISIASNSESVITVNAFDVLLSHIQNVKNSFCHCERHW